MAIQNNQLFLDRFIEYNVLRYKDNPSFVQVLQGLTLDKVELTNFHTTTTPAGKFANVFDISYPGVFIGVNQLFYAAEFTHNRVTVLEDEGLFTPEELEQRTDTGVYKVIDGSGAVLVLNGQRDELTVRTLIKEKCKYVVTDDQIQFGRDINDVITDAIVETNTIRGMVGVFESLFDTMPRYDGQYRLDGAVSAL